MGCVSRKPQRPICYITTITNQQKEMNINTFSPKLRTKKTRTVVYNPTIGKEQSVPILVPAAQSTLLAKRRTQTPSKFSTLNNID